ncbi:hypothetical protein Ciccas_002654 [Cichlidogyrus casuarinus]|uniref:CLEC16A/TT9 C-terminal domain-containing protein n=1 Tax=Cichlidogyrus casuarinus TaxID=1844966 RepID=A0ABD2QGK8_9PLAT
MQTMIQKPHLFNKLLLINRSPPEKRYLVFEQSQLLLVEPDSKKIGWAVVKYAGNLQDCQMKSDDSDYRAMHVKVYHPGQLSLVYLINELISQQNNLKQRAAKDPSLQNNSILNTNFASFAERITPQLAAKFYFDDYIRCLAGQSSLQRGLARTRASKIALITKLLLSFLFK